MRRTIITTGVLMLCPPVVVACGTADGAATSLQAVHTLQAAAKVSGHRTYTIKYQQVHQPSVYRSTYSQDPPKASFVVIESNVQVQRILTVGKFTASCPTSGPSGCSPDNQLPATVEPGSAGFSLDRLNSVEARIGAGQTVDVSQKNVNGFPSTCLKGRFGAGKRLDLECFTTTGIVSYLNFGGYGVEITSYVTSSTVRGLSLPPMSSR